MNRGATIHVISDERFASCKEHTMVTTYLASCRVGRTPEWLRQECSQPLLLTLSQYSNLLYAVVC